MTTTSQAYEALVATLSTLPGVRVLRDVVLAPYTTWKIGGPADILVEVEQIDALPMVLTELATHHVAWAVLGNGSNVLVADSGFRGAILRLEGELTEVRLTRDAFGPGRHRVDAGGGASLTKLLRVAKDESLSGLWVLGGIPGTVGGAVRMNAGTRWGEIKDTLVAARIASVAGLENFSAGALELAYRHSRLPPGTLIAEASFLVGDADEGMRQKLDEVLSHRKASQPLQFPSCGSVFANPPGDAAGRLIEAVGLKGHRQGGLQVATQHANWILNLGGGTARDAVALISLIQQRVFDTFGVALRPEVVRLGAFDTDAASRTSSGPDAGEGAP